MSMYFSTSLFFFVLLLLLPRNGSPFSILINHGIICNNTMQNYNGNQEEGIFLLEEGERQKKG